MKVVGLTNTDNTKKGTWENAKGNRWCRQIYSSEDAGEES
jgi:hypothetical protein